LNTEMPMPQEPAATESTIERASSLPLIVPSRERSPQVGHQHDSGTSTPTQGSRHCARGGNSSRPHCRTEKRGSADGSAAASKLTRRGRTWPQRQQWLIDDPGYMDRQIGDLRRGKAQMRASMAQLSCGELQENACLYTNYKKHASQSRPRTEVPSTTGLAGKGIVAMSRSTSSPSLATQGRRIGGGGCDTSGGHRRSATVTKEVRMLQQLIEGSLRSLETLERSSGENTDHIHHNENEICSGMQQIFRRAACRLPPITPADQENCRGGA